MKMDKKVIIMGLLGISQAAVNFGTYPITEDLVDDKSQSVNYEANTNFKTCSCDLTANSCDAFCCCDSDC
jgi:hypothetical protein